MVEESPLVYEMFTNGGQIGYPDDGGIMVYVKEKETWYTLDKTMSDFFPNGDMMQGSQDEMNTFYNYCASEWDKLRGL